MKTKTPFKASQFFIFLACLLLLQSCDLPSDGIHPIPSPPDNAPYRLEKENGRVYLILQTEEHSDTAEATEQTDDSLAGSVVADPHYTIPLPFTTLADLQNRILNYTVTEDELTAIESFDRDESGRTKLCDLTRVCDPALPEGISYVGGLLYGEKFILDLASEDGITGKYAACTAEEYRKEGYEALLSQEDMTVYQIADRSATVIENTFQSKEFRRYLYTVRANGVDIIVGEFYDLDYGSKIPRTVYVYIENETQCYYAKFEGFTTRPSVEWLSSVGIAHIE